VAASWADTSGEAGTGGKRAKCVPVPHPTRSHGACPVDRKIRQLKFRPVLAYSFGTVYVSWTAKQADFDYENLTVSAFCVRRLLESTVF